MAARAGSQVEAMKPAGRLQTCICLGVGDYGQRNTVDHLRPQEEAGTRLLEKLRHLKAATYMGQLGKSTHRSPGKMHAQKRAEKTFSHLVPC